MVTLFAQVILTVLWRIYAHHKVKANAGRVVLMRGPVLYCLEGMDNPDFSVMNMVLPKNMNTFTVKHDNDLLGGVTVLCGGGLADGEIPVQFIAIPNYAWLIEDPALCKN